MRARERELMSGRIHNPTELLQISEEVDHMKARLATEEDAELELMEEAERADAEPASFLAKLHFFGNRSVERPTWYRMATSAKSR